MAEKVDFFRECGDCFAPSAVDNPDAASERALLRGYAPDAPEDLLAALVAAFGELHWDRDVDIGQACVVPRRSGAACFRPPLDAVRLRHPLEERQVRSLP